MITREEWEAGAPVAITAADVPRIVAAYERAERLAEQVREMLAAARQPHSARDVWAGLDPAGQPCVYVEVPSPEHRRACENALSLLPGRPPTRLWRARSRDRPGRIVPAPASSA